MSKCLQSTSNAITRIEGMTKPIMPINPDSDDVKQVQQSLDLAKWYSDKLLNPSDDDLLIFPILSDDY